MEIQRNQTGGSAGRWNGRGDVYAMTNDKNEVKIGCTKNLKRRLQQVRRTEGNKKIKLMSSYKVPKKMRDAETAAQRAAKRKLGLKKSSSRGGATDWFASSRVSQRKVRATIREAVRKHNAKRPVRKHNAKRPVRKPNAKRPVRKSNAKRPVRKSNAKRPVRKPNAKRPVRKSNAKRPVRKPNAKRPVRKSNAKRPPVRKHNAKRPKRPKRK